ncbi:MAG TPA: hypothetical protein VHX15_01425 [Frankiaceae bacterium]|jgi:hypothetical protein|nr:hypothetical protein [Frankiaceae bacterium]
MSWLMWEAKAAAGQTDALVEWLLDQAPAGAQVYRSSDRVVLIAELPAVLDEPPAALVTRPPHSWEFDRQR